MNRVGTFIVFEHSESGVSKEIVREIVREKARAREGERGRKRGEYSRVQRSVHGVSQSLNRAHLAHIAARKGKSNADCRRRGSN